MMPSSVMLLGGAVTVVVAPIPYTLAWCQQNWFSSCLDGGQFTVEDYQRQGASATATHSRLHPSLDQNSVSTLPRLPPTLRLENNDGKPVPTTQSAWHQDKRVTARKHRASALLTTPSPLVRVRLVRVRTRHDRHLLYFEPQTERLHTMKRHSTARV